MAWKQEFRTKRSLLWAGSMLAGSLEPTLVETREYCKNSLDCQKAKPTELTTLLLLCVEAGHARGAKQELLLAAHRGAQARERGVGAHPELPHRLRGRAGVRRRVAHAARQSRRAGAAGAAAARAARLRERHQARSSFARAAELVRQPLRRPLQAKEIHEQDRSEKDGITTHPFSSDYPCCMCAFWSLRTQFTQSHDEIESYIGYWIFIFLCPCF